MTTLIVKADVEAVVHEDVEHVVTAKKRVIAVGLDAVLTKEELSFSSRENPCEE